MRPRRGDEEPRAHGRRQALEVRLTPRVPDAAVFRERLHSRGISLPAQDAGSFWLKVNETLKGASPAKLAAAFGSALT